MRPLLAALALSFFSFLFGGPICATALIPRACEKPHNKFPFCDPGRPTGERVLNLISLLRADEKPPLLTARMSPKGNVSRIGLPAYDWGANCVHGVQSRCVGEVCPSSFAMPSLLAASFSR
jgi:hypothetical protein